MSKSRRIMIRLMPGHFGVPQSGAAKWPKLIRFCMSKAELAIDAVGKDAYICKYE